MHHDGSVKVVRDDGKFVTCHCSICKIDIQEKYRAGRGSNSHKTWPHPSWPKTEQHIKGHAHFKSYLYLHGAEDEPSFWDSTSGKSEHEVNEMIREEHRQRLGGRTRWAMKVLNQGSRAKKSASTSNGSAGGDAPTALPSTRPVPAQLQRAQQLAQQLAGQLAQRLNVPDSGITGWTGRNIGASHLEVPNRSV